jgi:hypothetical protein
MDTKIKTPSFAAPFVMFLTLCIIVVSGEKKVMGEVNGLPAWITEEKIRSGNVHVDDDFLRAADIRSLGLNLVKAKTSFESGNSFNRSLRRVREWGKACKQNSLHLLIAYNWQPSIDGTVNYRRVVYSNGVTGIAPCPRDRDYWEYYLTRLGKVIANLSLETDIQVDGLMLDCELYGIDNKEDFTKQYGKHTCFCDSCFSTFLLAKGYTGNELPPVKASDPENWLRQAGFSDKYFEFLEGEVQTLAERCQRELHNINPQLLIGMYPHPYNWVLESVARGFGLDSNPVLIFAVHSYYVGGYRSIPPDPVEMYAKLGIRCIYIPGFLFRKYSSDEIRVNMVQAAKTTSGYWLYKLPMLWGVFRGGVEQFPEGTALDYRRAIYQANNDISAFLVGTNRTDSSGK